MIVLYSGTPGSGKSLDSARTICNWAFRGAPVICNFPINVDAVKGKRKDIRYLPNHELDPDKLVAMSMEYHKGKKMKEDSMLLIIDEAQLLFNARDWLKKGRDRWTWFFTMHRHFGYMIILCAQFDRMLDRQVRSLIEYEYVHRKVTNMGWKGRLLSLFMLSPVSLFVRVKIWYPMGEKVGSEFFKASRRYRKLYDTYEMLEAPDACDTAVDGGLGGPAAAVLDAAVQEEQEEVDYEDLLSPVFQTSDEIPDKKETETMVERYCPDDLPGNLGLEVLG